jgi:hypothetical protein
MYRGTVNIFIGGHIFKLGLKTFTATLKDFDGQVW